MLIASHTLFSTDLGLVQNCTHIHASGRCDLDHGHLFHPGPVFGPSLDFSTKGAETNSSALGISTRTTVLSATAPHGPVQATHGSDNFTDMFRRGTATPTNNTSPFFKETLGIFSHVFRRTHVQSPVFHTSGHTSVRLHGNGFMGHRLNTFQAGQHTGRPSRTIQSHDRNIGLFGNSSRWPRQYAPHTRFRHPVQLSFERSTGYQ